MSTKTLRFAHIINPFAVQEGSDAWRGQQIAQESLSFAKEQASHLSVRLYATGFEEDRTAASSAFEWTGNLQRSIADIVQCEHPRRLPLIADILDQLYSTEEADYYIYSNADIIVPPYFYETVAWLIAGGSDGFAFWRYVVHAKPAEIRNPQSIFDKPALRQRGFDVFVFRKEAVPPSLLGLSCVGIPAVDWSLLTAILAGSKYCSSPRGLCMSVDLADAKNWDSVSNRNYSVHNFTEFGKTWNACHGKIVTKNHPMWAQLQKDSTGVPRWLRRRWLFPQLALHRFGILGAKEWLRHWLFRF